MEYSDFPLIFLYVGLSIDKLDFNRYGTKMALPCLLPFSSDDIIGEAGGKSQTKKVLCSRFCILKL